MPRRCALLLAAGLLSPALAPADQAPPPADDGSKTGDETPQIVTDWCYRAEERIWYPPGNMYLWVCERAPDTNYDGCYEWGLSEQTYVRDTGEQEYAESCGDCGCAPPCFFDPYYSRTPAADPDADKTVSTLRLDRPLPRSAGPEELGLTREANPHVVVWPKDTPGFIVRVERDAETWWDLKLLPVTLVVNPKGPGGDPAESRVDTVHLGFQIERLAADERPMFTTSLGALRPARDGIRGAVLDGAYELRLGKETFLV
ncbi:MAG TPA: hypothetical protein VF170_11760, partial [Planctomycetaceae bacterium]